VLGSARNVPYLVIDVVQHRVVPVPQRLTHFSPFVFSVKGSYTTMFIAGCHHKILLSGKALLYLSLTHPAYRTSDLILHL
jgi:hypothetical protein